MDLRSALFCEIDACNKMVSAGGAFPGFRLCYEETKAGRALMRYVAALFIATVLIHPACAQTSPQQIWPQRPVTFIVSQSAGASPDVMARMIATKLSVTLGQTVIVENKPGAGNVIGAQAARGRRRTATPSSSRPPRRSSPIRIW